MKNLRRIYLLSAILVLTVGLALLFNPWSVGSQDKPLTYTNITNALSSNKLPPGVSEKSVVIRELIKLIKIRGVDKPLTADREDDLRQAGSIGKVQQSLIDEVIEAVRQNSPPLPGASTPTPTPTTPTPTTPTPVLPPTTPTPTANSNVKVEKNSLGMEFVRIPAGFFQMGSPVSEVGRSYDEVQHPVTISSEFFMGRHEVTQGQWKAVMGNNPSYNQKCGDNCPVEQVSWDDVQEFLAKLNSMGLGRYRLPTEAEWEYAARVGRVGEPFGIGDGKNLSSDLANFLGDYPYGNGQKGITNSKTVDVGSYPANPWGLFDMHGNVREWCSDWYMEKYEQDKQKDPKGPVAPLNGVLKVYRGGGFSSTGEGVRSALRQRNSPNVRNSSVGFRIVWEK